MGNAPSGCDAIFRFPSGDTRLVLPADAGDEIGAHVAGLSGVDRCALFTDDHVAGLWGSRIEGSLERAGLRPWRFVLRAGDANKTVAAAAGALEWLASIGADRHTAIVALGGGMVSDVAGFVAAVWMRGVPWAACPTTLLAMVDASLGGKTGVNLPAGKNLVGAFHHPQLIWADVTMLETLPPRDFTAGLAECVKHAVALEFSLLDWLEMNAAAIAARDRAVLSKLVERNLRIKAAVVAADERETASGGEVGRAALNFGHTIGHALEAVSGFAWPHGECVGLGMIAAMELAVALGTMQAAQCGRVKGLMRRMGLPLTAPAALDVEAVLAHLPRDKKSRHGRPRMVIPERLGRVVWHEPQDEQLLRRAIATIAPTN